MCVRQHENSVRDIPSSYLLATVMLRVSAEGASGGRRRWGLGFGCGRQWERVVQLLVPIRAAARCRYLFDSANSPRAPLELSPCTPRPTAASTLIGLDDGDDSWHQSRPLPNRRRGEEGRRLSWRRRRASLPSPRRMARQLLRGARITRVTRSARGRTHWATAQSQGESPGTA